MNKLWKITDRVRKSCHFMQRSVRCVESVGTSVRSIFSFVLTTELNTMTVCTLIPICKIVFFGDYKDRQCTGSEGRVMADFSTCLRVRPLETGANTLAFRRGQASSTHGHRKHAEAFTQRGWRCIHVLRAMLGYFKPKGAWTRVFAVKRFVWWRRCQLKALLPVEQKQIHSMKMDSTDLHRD